MSVTYKKINGVDFDPMVPDWQAELMCWKRCREPKFAHIQDPHECFMRPMRKIMTRAEWTVSPWTELHVHAWTNELDIICWGGASCEKTNTYGLLAVTDWLIDPANTLTYLVSTTLPGLMKRTFESVVRYHSILKGKNMGFAGKVGASAKSITMDGDEDVNPASGRSIKMGIWGVALKDGSVTDSVARIRGAHAKYVNYVADELSQMVEAAMAGELHTNLMVGSQVYRFAGLTNIDDFDDLAGRNSVPAGGWGSVNINTESWRTAGGRYIYRLDGFKSPALTEPDGEAKYPHLFGKRHLTIALKRANGNADAPEIYRQVRAWPPSVSGKPTPLTMAEAIQWGMLCPPESERKSVQWLSRPTPVVGVDPGFGGDDCDIQVVWVGSLVDLRKVILFDPIRKVPIKASLGSKPVVDQILDYSLPLFQTLGVKPEHVGVDDSGPQSVADAFARAWNRGIQRFSFGASPSETPVSAFNDRMACDWYSNQAAEIVYLFREYGQYHQIMNVPEITLSQITRREVFRRGAKLALQTKDEYKKVTGLGSPNEMDAGAVALGVVRRVIGLIPGGTEFHVNGPVETGFAGSEQSDFSAAAAEFHNLSSDYASPLV